MTVPVSRKFLLSIVPLTLLLVYISFKEAYGPYYLGTNSDPDYVYLVNGLSMAQFVPPGHVDHPGTTVQWISAATIRLVHLLVGQDSIEESVLKNPELYLAWINRVLCFVNLFSVLLVGLGVARFAPVWMAIVLQSSYFVSSECMYALLRVSPEPLLSVLGLWMAYLLLRCAYLNDVRQRRNFYIFSFACVAGLGMATKINFFPLVLIPLFILTPKKDALYYVMFSGLIAVTAAFPVIFSRKYFIKWIENLSTHSDLYGGGPTGVVNTDTFTKNAELIFSTEFAFTAVYLLLTVTLAVHFFWKKTYRNDLHIRLQAALWVAFSLQIVMVAKHYMPRYMLPSIMLSAVGLLLIFSYWKAHFHTHTKTEMKTVVFFCVLTPLLLLVVSYQMIPLHKSFKADKTDQMAVIEHVKKYKTKIPVLCYYRSSSQAFALQFSLLFAGLPKTQYNETLLKLYPNEYVYNIFVGNYYHWLDRADIIELISNHDKVIFQGSVLMKNSSVFIEHPQSGFHTPIPILKEVFRTKVEGIYELDSLRSGLPSQHSTQDN